MIKLSIKTKFMRAATMLLLMLLTTTTAWAGDTKILYDNSTEAKAAAGGSLYFYSNEACNAIISVNKDNNASSGSMVYIKARPDGIHKFGATDDNNLVSFIRVEVVTPNNDGGVLPVSKFADGIYTFTMPSDASFHVSVTVNFPERSTNADALTYIDEDGVEQTKAAGTVYILDGSEFTLGVDDQEIWYIAQGTDLAYTHTLSYYGNMHLILANGAAMSVTASGYDDGFHATGNSSLTICGQGGETEGSLTVRGYDGIDTEGNVIICSGIIDIASNSEGDGICASNITICGGQVTATGGSFGSSYGLNAGNNITLGWHKNTDRIMATGRDYAGYSTDVNIATDQRFVAFNAPTGTAASAIVSGTVSDQSTIAGKTLKPLDGNYIEATSGLQIGSLNGKDFTVRDADFSIDYAHYYLFSAAAEDVVVYYSNEYLPSDYHSIVWNVTGTSLKAYNYFGSGPRNMDNRYATFDMPGNADVTIDYESGGDGRMYQMPGGPLGSDSYWELSEDGSVLILDGTGDITVEKVDEWVNYNIKSISFSESVHYINNEVFAGLTHLETVSIGKNVERIGNGVFSGCTSLTSVTFPLLEYPSAINIGNGVFAGCTSLTSVTFQDTKVPTIGTDVFPENLTTIIVPAKALLSYLRAVGWSAYADKLISTGYCGKKIYNSEPPYDLVADYTTNLIWTLSAIANTTVKVNNEDVAALKLTVSANTADPVNPDAEEAFDMADGQYDDNITYFIFPWGIVSDEHVLAIRDIVIEDGVTSIGINAFLLNTFSNVTNATIGKDVKTIGAEAFRGTKLANVTFAENSTLEDIRYNAFRNTSLTNITIPASVKTIGGNAFMDCQQLETVTIEDSSEKPSQLTTIAGNAFENTKITTITLPKSVTDISYAFWGCTTLQTVNFAADATIEAIGYGAFYGCTSLTSITIPASVTMIDDDVFLNCTSLSAVTFAEGSALKTVSASAFDGCTTLMQNDYVLTLPTTVTDVFATGPEHLVTCLAAKLWSNVTEKLSYSSNCGVEVLDYVNETTINSANNVQFTMRSNGTLSDNSPALRMNIYKNTEDPVGENFSIADYTNADYTRWADARTSITVVEVGEGVTGIGNNAFNGCSALTTFRVMPTTAPALGSGVFDGCTALTIIAPASYKTADGWKSEGIVEKLRADREDLFTNGTEWMTWCGDFDWSTPAGCSVYVVSGVGENTVTLTALTETANADRTVGEENAEGIRIPAYTPVILQKTVANATGLQARFAKVGTVPASGYNATTGLVTQSESNFNMLGNATDAPVSGSITAGYSYALFDGEFLKIDDSTLHIPAHRCILTLDVPLSASRLSIVDGTQTGIGHTEITEITERTGAWYTLDGRKLDKQPTTKGLYIYKGKKVVIK